MATLTKKEILKRGFKKVCEDYYKLEGTSEEYRYNITLLACGRPQCRPRLFKISIDRYPSIGFDNKKPNSWTFYLSTVIAHTEEMDEFFKLARIYDC